MAFEFEGTGTIEKIDIFTTAKGKKIKTLICKVDGEYPQYVPVKLWGRAAEETFQVGDEVEIKGYLGGREYNGKYYGDITGRQVTVISSTGVAERSPGSDDDSSDIPF